MATQSTRELGSLSFIGPQCCPDTREHQGSGWCKEGRECWIGNSSSSNCVEGGQEGSEWRQEPREGLGKGPVGAESALGREDRPHNTARSPAS